MNDQTIRWTEACTPPLFVKATSGSPSSILICYFNPPLPSPSFHRNTHTSFHLSCTLMNINGITRGIISMKINLNKINFVSATWYGERTRELSRAFFFGTFVGLLETSYEPKNFFFFRKQIHVPWFNLRGFINCIFSLKSYIIIKFGLYRLLTVGRGKFSMQM